jgi:hypothetical protein
LLRKCSREERPRGVGDVGVEGSDINRHHDGVGGKKHEERPNYLKEMVGVFNIRGEGFDNGLEVGVDVC